LDHRIIYMPELGSTSYTFHSGELSNRGIQLVLLI